MSVVAIEEVSVAQAVCVRAYRDDDGQDGRIEVLDDGALAGASNADLVKGRDVRPLGAHGAASCCAAPRFEDPRLKLPRSYPSVILGARCNPARRRRRPVMVCIHLWALARIVLRSIKRHGV